MSDDLIARLEAATEGSRELDAEIALAVGWTKTGRLTYPWQTPGGEFQITCPKWTTSFDAALILLPAGMGWELRHFCTHPWAVSFVARTLSPHGEIEPPITVYAKTPALALCIAALNTRSQA